MTPTNAAALIDDFLGFPAPLALLDFTGRIELANASFKRLFGDVSGSSVTYSSAPVDEHWRNVELPFSPPDGRSLQARAVRLTHHSLLVVEVETARRESHDVDSLRRGLADLSQLTSIDPSTGVWNRAHFNQVIELELSRSVASRLPLSLILFDVDGLRLVNERFGAPVADQTLRALAQRVRAHLRGADMLFRWDGGQFVVLASAIGYRRSEFLAERIRECVCATPFPGVGAMSVSVAVAEHDGAEAMSGWYARLDAALHRAKSAGRNRVIVDRRGNSDRWAAAGASGLLHLAWQEGYECGEETIDSQHRYLFHLANNVIDASLQPTAAVQTPFDELIAHVRRHFADEEALLQSLSYAELDTHRQAHAALVRRALHLKAMVDGKQAPMGALVEFLAQDVVARHLLGVDVAFFPLIQTVRRRP